ncbi:MFS transporter [Amycolatopsis sp. RTGN1]|uniref:MFS transporter n=1 Tax=Amycolatopsis ponsaeliensis TaxID=2992142 RepID=UPI00254ED6B0|nr:MFS transporter [Amycolatopsis sp. RTGN1]
MNTVEPGRLSRNRAYTTLWTGMLLSELASESAFIAFPLLIIAHSGTAVQIGLVTSVLALARMAVNLPAGAIADRWDRKRLMVLAQCVRAAAMASVVAALLLDAYSIRQLLVVAVVEGAFSAVFQPAEHAALSQVVPAAQLSDALARNAARPFAALLLGPALAGFTFGLHELLPFAVGAGMLTVSFAALTLLRLPRRLPPSAPDEAGHQGLLDGFRWLFRQPGIRATVVWMVFVNLAFHALVIVILVVAGESNVHPGEIGLMMACFGAGGVLGATVAGRLHAALPAPVILIGSSWIFAGSAAALAFASQGVPAGALLGVAAVLMPVANTTVMTYQLVLTPDEIRGRLSGVVGGCADLAAAAGPVLGGTILAVTGDAMTGILVCAAVLALVAAGSQLSPTLRRLPLPGDRPRRTTASEIP